MMTGPVSSHGNSFKLDLASPVTCWVAFQLDVFVQVFAYFPPSKLLESAGQVVFELITV